MLIILNLSFLEFNILQDKNESALCPLSASEELFMDKINNGWVPFRFLLEIERKPNRYLKGIKIKKNHYSQTAHLPQISKVQYSDKIASGKITSCQKYRRKHQINGSELDGLYSKKNEACTPFYKQIRGSPTINRLGKTRPCNQPY